MVKHFSGRSPQYEDDYLSLVRQAHREYEEEMAEPRRAHREAVNRADRQLRAAQKAAIDREKQKVEAALVNRSPPPKAMRPNRRPAAGAAVRKSA